MNTEFASILNETGRIVDWAEKVTYKLDLNAEDKEISSVTDAWLKEVVGRTGHDSNHEISQLIAKAISAPVVETPSIILERAFNQTSIGEFDDIMFESEPENTIKVYDAILGGNVDRSYIGTNTKAPTWKSLQAETEVSLQEIRRGGFRTVANLVTYIREAMEYRKLQTVMSALVDSILSSETERYFAGTAANGVGDAEAKALALYLHDVSDGETPLMVAQNKHLMELVGTDGIQNFLTDKEKNLFNNSGFLKMFAGCELEGFSGQKKIGGSVVFPANVVLGIAGKVGDMAVRGEANVYQETDINSEKIHIKVNGFTFGYAITHPEMVGKIVLA